MSLSKFVLSFFGTQSETVYWELFAKIDGQLFATHSTILSQDQPKYALSEKWSDGVKITIFQKEWITYNLRWICSFPKYRADLKYIDPNVLWGRSTLAVVMNITVLNCQRNVAACATAYDAAFAYVATAAATWCRSRRVLPQPPPVTSRGAGKTAGNFRQQQ